MKKIFLTLAAALTISIGFTSCGDNTDFWGLHNLTDDELAEMARQDSIARERKNHIDADLILTHDVSFYISSTSYDGAEVDMSDDMQQIADLFGLDKTAMCTDLDNWEGDVVPFAIEGSTHADNMNQSTAGTYWGNWWNADGDVCSWGSTAAVFNEFYGEDLVMNIGQYPGVLTDGQTVKIIDCLKYKDKRVAVVFNITAMARGEVKATVVGTSNVSITMSPQTDYSSNPLAIPADEICKNLGISSMADAQFLSVNTDGSYCQETDDGWGFWMDKSGYKGTWGDQASVMVGWDPGASEIGVLQMPDGLAAGESVVAHVAFLANNKIQLVDVTVNIKAYEDPETAPTGDPYATEKDVTLELTYNTDWNEVTADIKEILRDAFKMTTYQIFKAIKSGDLKCYLGEVTEGDPAYTADATGYWLDSEGKSVEYGTNSVVYLMIESSETSLELGMGNHPESCPPAGVSMNEKYIVTCNGGKVTFNVAIKVNPASAAKKNKAIIRNHKGR